jgi:Biotin carboxylase, N-terminal domain
MQPLMFISYLLLSLMHSAVWPGWGHASENPRLPSTLKEKGIQVGSIMLLIELIRNRILHSPNVSDSC